ATLVVVGNASMSPQDPGEYQSESGVPGCEFSQTMALEPGPHGPVSAEAAWGAATAATMTTAAEKISVRALRMNLRKFIFLAFLGRRSPTRNRRPPSDALPGAGQRRGATCFAIPSLGRDDLGTGGQPVARPFVPAA